MNKENRFRIADTLTTINVVLRRIGIIMSGVIIAASHVFGIGVLLAINQVCEEASIWMMLIGLVGLFGGGFIAGNAMCSYSTLEKVAQALRGNFRYPRAQGIVELVTWIGIFAATIALATFGTVWWLMLTPCAALAVIEQAIVIFLLQKKYDG